MSSFDKHKFRGDVDGLCQFVNTSNQRCGCSQESFIHEYRLPPELKKLRTSTWLTTNELDVWLKLRNEAWAQMQGIFPRLKEYRGPRLDDGRLQPRMRPPYKHEQPALPCDICGPTVPSTRQIKYPVPDPKGGFGQYVLHACHTHTQEALHEFVKFQISLTNVTPVSIVEEQ